MTCVVNFCQSSPCSFFVRGRELSFYDLLDLISFTLELAYPLFQIICLTLYIRSSKAFLAGFFAAILALSLSTRSCALACFLRAAPFFSICKVGLQSLFLFLKGAFVSDFQPFLKASNARFRLCKLWFWLRVFAYLFVH